jgi:hypothetical protein
VDASPPCVDRIEVRETEDELTLILEAASVHLMQVRLRYDGMADEVVNSAGVVATWPVNAWVLTTHELSLEFDERAAEALGFPRDCQLRLKLDDDAIGTVRAALLEILQCACFVVDTIEGRIEG